MTHDKMRFKDTIARETQVPIAGSRKLGKTIK